MAVSKEVSVRVICGPTGAGKTAVALWLAAEHDLTIISADSRQLYRGFDIGTAKPSAADRESIPHRGIDVLDPGERASAAWWADAADHWIDEASAAARTPLVVGGTGLYLRALFAPLFEEPALDPARRRELQRFLDGQSTDELRRWTLALDPPRARFGRTQLLRAVEIALLTGRPLSALHRQNVRPARRAARYLVIDPGPSLAEQIAVRTRTMLDGGWPEEVADLMARVPAEAPAWNASGYRAVREMIEGRTSRREAEERIVIETRQYAKRQRTWFRHQLVDADVTRLSPAHAGWQEATRLWWAGQHA